MLGWKCYMAVKEVGGLQSGRSLVRLHVKIWYEEVLFAQDSDISR